MGKVAIEIVDNGGDGAWVMTILGKITYAGPSATETRSISLRVVG